MFKYDDLLEEIDKFSAYGCETGVIGESGLNQRIPYVFIGSGKQNNIIVQGAIHGREHITALLVLCMAKHLLKNSALSLLGGIYFIPMVNPDGVRLCQEGVRWIANKKTQEEILALNNGDCDFTFWKANARGVDLNVNFDAGWGSGKQNVFAAASENYVGQKPESESESHALANFTRALKPMCTLSYHTKGEVIYWRYSQKGTKLWRHYRLAKALSEQTGYELTDNMGSAGGYKDWCISKLDIPSFTVEVGRDDIPHPYPYARIRELLAVHEDIPRRLVNTLVKQKEKTARKQLKQFD